MKFIGRREFMRDFFLGSFSVILSSSKAVFSKEKFRIRKGDMFYRRPGRTNLFISEISLGGSPVLIKTKFGFLQDG